MSLPRYYTQTLEKVYENGQIKWGTVRTQRSCDLIPLHYFLWGAFEIKCYAVELEKIECLKANIRDAIVEVLTWNT